MCVRAVQLALEHLHVAVLAAESDEFPILLQTALLDGVSMLIIPAVASARGCQDGTTPGCRSLSRP